MKQLITHKQINNYITNGEADVWLNRLSIKEEEYELKFGENMGDVLEKVREDFISQEKKICLLRQLTTEKD